jgi:2-C-methyl-D-erythritol 4-phosphate cytidylyltransferase
MPDDLSIIVIHDAARPLITHRMVNDVITAARQGNGAAPGLPVVDTLKRVDREGRIQETVDRSDLVRVQTPQAFPRKMIDEAHRRALAEKIIATDDAALCERLGMPVVIVPGSERALKITTEEDFARAEALSILRE